MRNGIIIPKGRFATDDDAALRAKREALKKKLLEGGKITLKPSSTTTDNPNEQGSTINIPKGKLATDDDAALRAKREALKKKLLEGGKITLKPSSTTTDNPNEQGSTINIPKGKLARQWYESDPVLLEAEKAAMKKFFPGFTLDKLEDGRLFWTGALAPGVYETKFGRRRIYTVMAVYQNNHPVQKMGSSVYVYLIYPDIDDIIKEYGKCPHHLLHDSVGDVYLCTAHAEDIKTGNTVTSAASVLAWAVKWLLAYELVLTGDLSKEEFDGGNI